MEGKHWFFDGVFPKFYVGFVITTLILAALGMLPLTGCATYDDPVLRCERRAHYLAAGDDAIYHHYYEECIGGN